MSEMLIVGTGNLGKRIGKRGKGRVVGETLTEKSHEELRSLGIVPRLRTLHLAETFSNVVVCCPPSTCDYQNEIPRALKLWDGTGVFLFTSSTAVYAEEDGGTVVENSPEAETDRAKILLGAEKLVRRGGGTVVRLAGLYSSERGPHRAYERAKISPLTPNGLINLIHYDDAAALCWTILQSKKQNETFLGCDNHPLTRKEISPTCDFLGTDGPMGRRCDNSHTRNSLSWQPQWESFLAWRAQNV